MLQERAETSDESGRVAELRRVGGVDGSGTAELHRVALHDDRLVSAALVAEMDRLVREGKVRVGGAESAVIKGIDPMEELSDW